MKGSETSSSPGGGTPDGCACRRCRSTAIGQFERFHSTVIFHVVHSILAPNSGASCPGLTHLRWNAPSKTAYDLVLVTRGPCFWHCPPQTLSSSPTMIPSEPPSVSDVDLNLGLVSVSNTVFHTCIEVSQPAASSSDVEAPTTCPTAVRSSTAPRHWLTLTYPNSIQRTELSPTAIGSHEQVLQCLVSRSFSKDELPSLLDTIFSSGGSTRLLLRLQRDNAQVIVDILDEVRHRTLDAQKIDRFIFLSPSANKSTRHWMAPVSHQVPGRNVQRCYTRYVLTTQCFLHR